VGCTTERADQAPALGVAAMTCGVSAASGQKRQAVSGPDGPSAGSSPVITQERVMGSLRSSMHKESIAGEAASTAISRRIEKSPFQPLL
jgi:hypothetical protein